MKSVPAGCATAENVSANCAFRSHGYQSLVARPARRSLARRLVGEGGSLITFTFKGEALESGAASR